MHDYRRFVQEHLDALGWKPAQLVKASGLSRQLISSILKDNREYLGQMPDDSTLQRLADGFDVPVQRVRTAAARSLVGYVDDGSDLIADLESVHIDALLQEIRRRVVQLPVRTAAQSHASEEGDQDENSGGSDDDSDPDRSGGNPKGDDTALTIGEVSPSLNDAGVEVQGAETFSKRPAVRRGNG